MLLGIAQLFAFAAFVASVESAFGGVTVVQNVSPGATNWPGNPVAATMANPFLSGTVIESFNGGTGGNTNLSQTFTITGTNFTLSAISLYASGGTGTGTGTNIILQLFDLGNQSAPNPTNYNGGANLFNSGNGLAIAYAPQAAGVLEFDFTGADQVTLQAGHMYAFALGGAANTTPAFWTRATNDTYSGGAAYRNQSWINGNNARDFALAVYTLGISNGQCSVNWTDLHQRIDGFGGGAVFFNPGSLDPITDANMDTLYGTANSSQLGLSLLRIRIDPNTNWANALSDAQKAVARGAGVLATPWTPPAVMKDNNSLTNGGSLLPSQYANYASYLKSFADYLSANGAPLRAISVQNEPDFLATYESCLWTGSQFQTFFHNNAAAIGSTPVMMPESEDYKFSLSDPTLNDPAAVTNVAIIGGHLYGAGTIQDYTNAHNKGKPTWMTEFLINDQTIETAIDTAAQIHECLTIGNMSAYIWWKTLGDANGLVNASGVPQNRGFVMAQFSRFVRPNYYRIGTVYDTNSAVTAFKDLTSPQFAIVAINSNATFQVNETFSLSNFTAAAVTPWVTSASQSLDVQPSVTVSNGAFSYLLPPLSVVTFVGQATSVKSPLTLTPVANQTINAGVTLLLTNSANDPNVPPQSLSFSLLNGPTNATLTMLNASNALFTWRPLVGQAGTTNLTAVKVSDNASPTSSATNTFTVKVNPLGQASFSSITLTGGQAQMRVAGPVGPDYWLLSSTNLVNWSLLYQTNSPFTPFTLMDTNPVNAARFYRLQLAP